MIKLTDHNGDDPIYINPSLIISVNGSISYSNIETVSHTHGSSLVVKESPEEVVRLIVKANHRKIMSEELYKLYFSTAKDYKEIEKTFQDVFTKMVENEMP